jgi:hypothetical protein
MAKLPPCHRSEIEHVRRFVTYAKHCLDQAGYYPPVNAHRYMVALALYSKCITVAEAVLALIDAGFGDEAFAMTRTLVDVFITLRFITNRDTDDRAKRYAHFTAKESEQWEKVAREFWPQNPAPPLSTETKEIAATFPRPHKWSGKSVWEMATEDDTFENDPSTGKPLVHSFAYRVVYRWTSLYVHPTVGALWNHLVQAGRDVFKVRSWDRRDMRHMALFNTAAYLSNTMVAFHRCMGDPQPSRLGTWSGAIMAHLARRHG